MGSEVAREFGNDREEVEADARAEDAPPATGTERTAEASEDELRRRHPPPVRPPRVHQARRELAAQRVLVRRSRVHTPTDNPATGRGAPGRKEESGLGQGVEFLSHAEAAARLAPARTRLNEGRLRVARDRHDAAELDPVVPRADAGVDRDEFHDLARAAMTAAVLGHQDPDASRPAEREALITTLCELGLARRHVNRRLRVGTIPMPESRRTHGAAARNG